MKDGKWVQKKGSKALDSFEPSYPLLVYAAIYGRPDLIELLVEKFACDVNIRAMPKRKTHLHFQRTALHLAVLCGHVTTVDMLLKLGANPNIKDRGGMTPFDLLQSESALNALSQACSYDELYRWDNLETNVESRRKEKRVHRVNISYSKSERDQMRKLLQSKPTSTDSLRIRSGVSEVEASGAGSAANGKTAGKDDRPLSSEDTETNLDRLPVIVGAPRAGSFAPQTSSRPPTAVGRAQVGATEGTDEDGGRRADASRANSEVVKWALSGFRFDCV